MRVLLDNNILVSSLIAPNGPPARLADAWRDGRFELVTSAEQLARLAEVFARPRIQALVGSEPIVKLLADMEFASIVVTPRFDIDACIDPEDNLILGTAVAGRVDCLSPATSVICFH